MFKFNPVSDKEIDKSLEPGEANFVVWEAEYGVSQKTGAQQLIIVFEVWDSCGVKGYVKDYFPAAENMMWKLRAFCRAIKQPHLYYAGTIDGLALLGAGGQCILGIKPATDGYAERVVIQKYVEAQPAAPQQVKNMAPAPSSTLLAGEDDLPF